MGAIKRALRARFHRRKQRQEGDNRFARRHIALQQPQHAQGLRHVAFDFGKRA